MQRLKDYDVRFSGLKLGEHSFEYQLTKEFFELFEYRDFEAADILARLSFTKKESSLELDFHVQGKITVPCDITTEPFDLPIEAQMKLMVKFGEEYNDSDEEILILPMAEHTLNVAQYFYELAVLAVPLKRVRPDLEESEEGKAILAQLEQLDPKNSRPAVDEEPDEVDPRWNKLKDLLN